MVKVALTVEGDTGAVISALRQLAVGEVAFPVAPPPEIVVESEPAPRLTAGAPAPEMAAETPPMPGAMPMSEPEPEPPPVPEGEWSIDHVRVFWSYLSDNVQEVYHRVAHSAGYVLPRQDLLDSLDLTERQLSGRMSSQGHAVRRMRRLHNIALPHPMSFDAATDDYKMLADVADAIVRLNLTPTGV